MIGAAITLYDLVPTGSVVAGHGGYGDPLFPSFGTNVDFAPTTDPVRPDLGLAGIIGWTQPASAAVDPDVVVPGYGAGTAELTDDEPTGPAIDPLTPDQVAAGVVFIGANGVAMEGTLVADCPSQFSVCLQDNGGNPIRGALIFASTDQAGADIVEVTISDQSGNAEFTGLEIGSYYATTEINRQTVDVRPFEVKN